MHTNNLCLIVSSGVGWAAMFFFFAEYSRLLSTIIGCFYGLLGMFWIHIQQKKPVEQIFIPISEIGSKYK